MNEVLFCIIFPVFSHPCLQFPRLLPSRYWMFPLGNIKLLSVSPHHHPPPRGWAWMGLQRVCLCVFGGLLAAEAMLGLPSAAAAKHSAAFPSAPVLLPRTNAPTDWLNSCPGYIDVCVSVYLIMHVFFFYSEALLPVACERLHWRVKWRRSVCESQWRACFHLKVKWMMHVCELKWNDGVRNGGGLAFSHGVHLCLCYFQQFLTSRFQILLLLLKAGLPDFHLAYGWVKSELLRIIRQKLRGSSLFILLINSIIWKLYHNKYHAMNQHSLKYKQSGRSFHTRSFCKTPPFNRKTPTSKILLIIMLMSWLFVWHQWLLTIIPNVV